MTRERLKGAQLSFLEEKAYGVRFGACHTVLCDMHVDLVRLTSRDPVKFTGKTFPVGTCEHCIKTLVLITCSEVIQDNQNKDVA